MKILREMWVRDEFENILLSVVAVILSICLVGLIFLATNQNAFSKSTSNDMYIFKSK